jgi:hypothetical protein
MKRKHERHAKVAPTVFAISAQVYSKREILPRAGFGKAAGVP